MPDSIRIRLLVDKVFKVLKAIRPVPPDGVNDWVT